MTYSTQLPVWLLGKIGHSDPLPKIESVKNRGEGAYFYTLLIFDPPPCFLTLLIFDPWFRPVGLVLREQVSSRFRPLGLVLAALAARRFLFRPLGLVRREQVSSQNKVWLG